LIRLPRRYRAARPAPKVRYEAVAVGVAERDSRESQREAVLRLMIPLLTAFPKARLTTRI